MVGAFGVFGGKPQLGPIPILGEGDNGTAHAAHKAMHHRAQQGPSLLAGGGSEGQPDQRFFFGDGPTDDDGDLL